MLKLLFLFFGICINTAVFAEGNDQVSEKVTKAAIASAHPLATKAGLEILDQGGNAFDAAVAVSATLAVVEPYSSGMGGGGFWLLHRQSDQKQIMIDGREMAPGKARKNMYLDDDTGEVIKGASLDGALAAGIPGQIAALVHLAENYGKLPLSKTFAAAIYYAKNGFEVTEKYQKLASFRHKALVANKDASDIFLLNKQIPPLGHKIIQNDLANTLEAVVESGAAGFYQGQVAKKLIVGVTKAGGIWSENDLKNYKVIEREPVTGTYQGIKITSASPPSSGGIVLIETLNILERKNLFSFDSVTKKHVIVEAMKRAYKDRAEYLGDPDFVNIPKSISSKPYATIKAASIKLDQATAVDPLDGKAQTKGTDTTHFSIVDAEGNRVSATLSINYPFGACFVVPGTGVLLNDEMDDFSIRDNTPNAYGLIGNKNNQIAPGKRPLSSMTPTFLETDERIAILGTPGGSRIISMVLLAVLDFAEKKAPDSWVSLPRYHHQYQPDEIQHEVGTFSIIEQQGLRQRGHILKEKSRRYGNMQAILINKKTGEISAASDPRGEGLSTVQ